MEKKIKCKYCGEDFILGRGKKTDHCKKEDCLRQAKNEAQRKWYANKMKVLNGTKNRIIEQKEEKKIVYSSTDKAINGVNNEDFTEVITLARELGAIRFKIKETINKCRPSQSICDTEDQIFLHKFEDLAKQDEVYMDDIVQLFTEQIDKRQNRRFLKDKVEMLEHLIQGVISNPNAYVMEFIKNRDKRTYKPQIKEGKNETNKR